MSLGVIGAGRLGAAVARAWIIGSNERARIWSRGGPRDLPLPEESLHLIDWIDQVEAIFGGQYVFSAISGKALKEVVSNHSAISDFEGMFFCAAPEVDFAQLSHLLPRADCVRVAPFLLGGALYVLAFPMPTSRETALGILSMIGEVDAIEEQEAFEALTLLGSPFPVVVSHALRRFVEEVCRGDQVLSRKILFRGLRSLLEASIDGEAQVVTPGGITEQGLKRSGDIEETFRVAFRELEAAVKNRRSR